MKKYFLLLLLLTSFKIFAQQNYIKGYYVNNMNVKIDCSIVSFDISSNISKIEVIDGNSKLTSLPMESIIEFGFYEGDKSVFKRFDVSIDESSDLFTKLSTDFNANYVNKRLFLEHLVSGKANLYVYRCEDYTRFFYTIDNSLIQQLEYKKYLDRTEINENNRYKQVLYNLFKDANVDVKKIESVRYEEKDLVDLFNKYNSYYGLDNKIDYKLRNDKRKIDFNINLRPGVNFSSVVFKNNNEDFYGDAVFDMKSTIRLGIEFEFMLNKVFSLITEPTYRSYENTGNQIVGSLSPTNYEVKLKYNSIEIPFGIRRYFPLTNDLNWFANGAIKYDINLGDKYEETIKPGTHLNSFINFSIGIGLKFKDKYFAELNYDTPRNLSSTNSNRVSRYKNFSVLVGYKLF